jgi:hypothetical protein
LKTDVTVTDLTNAEKCTFVVKASADAPGLRIKSSSEDVKSFLEINYIEYDNSAFRLTASGKTDFIDGKVNANTPTAQLYTKNQFKGGELPYFS